MGTLEKDASVTVGIGIPVNSSESFELQYVQKKKHSSDDKICASDNIKFHNLSSSLDPNLGIMAPLSSSDIPYEKSPFNSWNIEPHFLHVLPVSTLTNNESFILVFGGLDPSSVAEKESSEFRHEDFVLGSTIFQYLLSSKVWNYYGTMIEPRCYHVCVLIDQHVYITGGYSMLKRRHNEMLSVSSVDKLDLGTGQWKRCANMINSRAAHAAVSYKTQLYVFGGRNSQGNILASIEFYDVEQDLWNEISFLPRPTMGLSAACILDDIWLIGGIINENAKNPAKCLSSDVFCFSPLTKRCHTKQSLPNPSAFSKCIFDDHSLWLIGGCTFSENSKKETMVSCSSILKLSLSSTSPKWKSTASLLHPRHALTAVLYDKIIYVFGGIESAGNITSNKVELINTTINMTIETSKMPACIAGSSSVLIAQNSVDYSFNKGTKKRGISKVCAGHPANFLSPIKIESSSADFNFSNAPHSFSRNETMVATSMISDIEELQDKKYFNNISNKKIKKSDDIVIFESDRDLKNSERKTFKEGNDTSSSLYKNENFDVKYRTSMEIFLKSDMTNNHNHLNILKKRDSCVEKWQKYFGILSDESIHKRLLRSKEKDNTKSYKSSLSPKETFSEQAIKSSVTSLKSSGRRVDIQNYSSSTTVQIAPQQSFLYVQSNLAYQPTSIDSHLDIHKTARIADSNKDNLPAISMDATKISSALPVILLMGGEDPLGGTKSNSILLYSCPKDIWEYVGYMPENRCFHSAVFLKQSLYIIGGFDSDNSREFENITEKVIYYDFNTKVWLAKTNMNYPRAFHTTILFNGEIYAIGGRDQLGNIISSVEAYDESKNEWKECQQLPYPLLGAAATIVNNVLYVIGGITYLGEDEVISSGTLAFDSKNKSWSVGSDLPTFLAFAGASNFSNFIWLFGGLTENGFDLISTNHLFKMDVTATTWNKEGELSIPRHATITVSLGTKVYILGGYSTQAGKEVEVCEVIDLTDKSVSLIKSLPNLYAVAGRAGALITSIE